MMKPILSFDLILMQSAGHYNLHQDSERARSASDLRKLFLSIQEQTRPRVTLEIGAFDAEFSIEMKRRLKNDVRAIAFEASPYNFEHFRNKAEIILNGVEYLHLAIGQHTGEVRFMVQKKIQGTKVDGVRGNNSLLSRIASGIEYEELRVPSTSLADFLTASNLDRAQYAAWIDVEGASEGVLRGAGSMLNNCLSLMIEVEEAPYWEGQWLFQDVIEYLFERDFIPVARDFEYAHQFNVVFVRSSVFELTEVRRALTDHFSQSSLVEPCIIAAQVAQTKAEAAAKAARAEIEALRASTSWHITAPLRSIAARFRRSRCLMKNIRI